MQRYRRGRMTPLAKLFPPAPTRVNMAPPRKNIKIVTVFLAAMCLLVLTGISWFSRDAGGGGKIRTNGSQKNSKRVASDANMDDIVVIIVLGEMLIAPSGEMTRNLQNRLQTAQQYVTDSSTDVAYHVILSGGDTAKTGKTEAAAMKEWWNAMMTADSSSNVVLHTEEQSLSTCQNAFYSIPIIIALGSSKRTIVVVTSDYHAPRAKLLFEQVFATEGAHYKVATYSSPTEPSLRKDLFTNERKWLHDDKLELLLTHMEDHPFNHPNPPRVQQAFDELKEAENDL